MLREECALTPLWGTDTIACRVLVKNIGKVNEKDIVVILDVPYLFFLRIIIYLILKFLLVV